MERKLYKKDNTIIVEAINDIEMKDQQGNVTGIQISNVRQEWKVESFDALKTEVLNQKESTVAKIDEMKSQMSKLPKFSDRELQNLIKFRENFEKVQQLQKVDQLEEQIKAHQDGLDKIEKDLEELNNVQ